MRPHITIPADYEVQPLKPGQSAIDPCRCYTCGLAWDDGIVTSITPVPGARCPFEAFHPHEEDEPSEEATTIIAFMEWLDRKNLFVCKWDADFEERVPLCNLLKPHETLKP